jgi:hypothetical protein
LLVVASGFMLTNKPTAKNRHIHKR